MQLDGSSSFDPDGDALTYTWMNGLDNVVATGQTPSISLPLGTHIFILTVDDGRGGTDSDLVAITVQDTIGPDIEALVPNPQTLWPPNHRMVTVSIKLSVTDVCDPHPSCRIVAVRSNEPIDGRTSPDWIITGPLTVSLRAERSIFGTGRRYRVTVRCTDHSGNSSTATVIVRVPRFQH